MLETARTIRTARDSLGFLAEARGRDGAAAPVEKGPARRDAHSAATSTVAATTAAAAAAIAAGASERDIRRRKRQGTMRGSQQASIQTKSG